MKKSFLLIILITTFLSSCDNRSYDEIENEAWSQLFEFEFEKANKEFEKLASLKKTDKNILGLAYTQAILEKDNYYNTINNYFKDPKESYQYGFLVAAFKVYNDNGRKDLGDFSFEEFKAMHLGAKFKVKKNLQIIIGEYKDLKPFGVWKYYNLNNELVREIDFNQKILN
jgi:hypothetical protein